jgi:hypothetical protein
MILKVTLQRVSPKRHGVCHCQGYDERGLRGISEREIRRRDWDRAHILSFHEVDAFPCPSAMKRAMVHRARGWHQDQ